MQYTFVKNGYEKDDAKVIKGQIEKDKNSKALDPWTCFICLRRDLTSFTTMYEVVETLKKGEKFGTYLEQLAGISCTKSMNRFTYYCHKVEKGIGEMDPIEKGFVYEGVKKTDSYHMAITRYGGGLEEVVIHQLSKKSSITLDTFFHPKIMKWLES